MFSTSLASALRIFYSPLSAISRHLPAARFLSHSPVVLATPGLLGKSKPKPEQNVHVDKQTIKQLPELYDVDIDINKPGSLIVSESSFKAQETFLRRLAYKLGLGEVNIFALRRASIYIYAACTDQIDVEKFFEHCQIEDTVYSWYLVTELHLWMCNVRSMAEGPEGRKLRNETTERLWVDVDRRLVRLEMFSSSTRHKVIEDLLLHLQASLFSYDEGLLTDDKTLAGALWRTFYSKRPDMDPALLEMMVHYVRTQLAHLRSIGPREWCLSGKFQWKKFPPLIT